MQSVLYSSHQVPAPCQHRAGTGFSKTGSALCTTGWPVCKMQVQNTYKACLIQFLDVLQLHGMKAPNNAEQIAAQCKRRWYKAIQVKPDLDVVAEIQRYQVAGASVVLLDAWHPDLKGEQDTVSTEPVSPTRYSTNFGRGLNPEKMSDAIDTTAAFAVDVSEA